MVDTSAIVRRAHPILFITLAVISFIAAVIASTIVTDYNNNGNPPSTSLNNATRFTVFASWWTFVISTAYAVLFLINKGGVFTSIAGHAISTFLTFIFVTASAGSLTDATGGALTCSRDRIVYCGSTRALQAFVWIEWGLLVIILALVAFIGAGSFRGGRSVKEPLTA
ncbi:hypothetical protein PSEUBRA_005159 [Kalmanozyma brasiliensis GHG001]|uniref:MARVEL domain-containing protein n=1 Tax=Kalmanozyma brasiliensis (strain GHG001) TaxID=1365824 RepID=V5ERB0_KALBG|nr:uncharacterized protein PSEUBRA_005159 [Kalmanozyma brasiliensis GHG001]EST05478.1 hypothetical protein PSEUBRA_005159 [Kalmanozyma brasiliensis GHG001]